MSMDVNTTLATQAYSKTGFDEAAKTAARVKTEAEIDAAAKDFEAMFVAEMMKPMFEGLEVDPMFGGGKGEEVFRGLLLQEYGKVIAETGQMNIAASIKAQLLQSQEIARTGSIILSKKDHPAPAPTQESAYYDTSI